MLYVLKGEVLLLLKERYINIPIKNHTDTTLVLVKNELGDIVRYFDISLPTNKDDFDCTIPYDMNEFIGQKLTFEPNINFEQSSNPLDTVGLYKELNRSQFHFSSRWGWLNDPNGLFYYNGIYHLFYQHNPVGVEWGNMHWGHATSSDLIHWREDTDVLFPDKTGTMYSGSAIVDYNNDSGLQDGKDPVVLLFYTAAGSHAPQKTDDTQCLAYSIDGGNTFEKYEKNPIVPHISSGNRDPKVIWNNSMKTWMMSLFVSEPYDKFVLLKSNNLLDWEMFQDNITIDRGRECPDVFPLKITGEKLEKWVFIEANGNYLIGDFVDGQFVAETDTLGSFATSDQHEYCYAGQTWSNMPNNRRVFIGWQRGDCDNFRFNQTMTIPLEFTLERDNDNKLYLAAWPIKEFESLRKECFEYSIYDESSNIDNEIDKILLGDSCWDIVMKLSRHTSGKASFFGYDLFFDLENDVVLFNELSLQLNGTDNIRIIIDRASIEIFIGNGRTWVTKRRINSKHSKGINFEVPEVLEHISLYPIKSIWLPV
jgi:sucrose-6-phosphate hydrolase SacC (GH32 family)